ncbi:MAG: hypothetical protein L6R39_000308 [Caloplaca ligustica]|nr:MAG: hypothetical protein L6R39_000308 [Caloplaca ligustica]
MQSERLTTLTRALRRQRSELLEKEEKRTANKTRGKAKASERDREEEADFKRRLAEIDDTIADVRDVGDNISNQKEAMRPARNGPSKNLATRQTTDEYHCALRDICNDHDDDTFKLKEKRPSGQAIFYDKAGTTAMTEDEEPIWNPFTDSYAYRETGFEPGPSHSSRKLEQHQQDAVLEDVIPCDVTSDVNNEFKESYQDIVQYPETAERKALEHTSQEPIDAQARTETLQPNSPAVTPREIPLTENFDPGDNRSSQTLAGRLASLSNRVQAWTAPGLGRWLFGATPIVDAAGKGSSDGTKSHRRRGSSSTLSSNVTYLGSPLSSASLISNRTPESSVSSDHSPPPVLSPSKPEHGSSMKPEDSQSKKGNPIPGHLSAENQGFSECKWSVPQRLQRQRLRRILQDWDTQRQKSEDRALAEALELEEEILHDNEQDELSRRLAVELQLQEDRQMAERQAESEQAEVEWQRGMQQVQKASSTIYEAERLRGDLRAQEAAIQADRELAARLEESEHGMLSSYEFALQLQAKLERSETIERTDRRHHRRSWGLIPITNQAPPTLQPTERQASRASHAAPNINLDSNDLGALVECVACTERFPRTQLVRPCKHFYCQGCLAGKVHPSIKCLRIYLVRTMLTTTPCRMVPGVSESQKPAKLLRTHLPCRPRVKPTRSRLCGTI